jgi:hypothetical protein
MKYILRQVGHLLELNEDKRSGKNVVISISDEPLLTVRMAAIRNLNNQSEQVELPPLNVSKRAANTKNTANSYPSASFISPLADLRSLFISEDSDRDSSQVTTHCYLRSAEYSSADVPQRHLIFTAGRRSIWHHYKAISSWSSVIKSLVPYSRLLCHTSLKNRNNHAINYHHFSCLFFYLHSLI